MPFPVLPRAPSEQDREDHDQNDHNCHDHDPVCGTHFILSIRCDYACAGLRSGNSGCLLYQAGGSAERHIG